MVALVYNTTFPYSDGNDAMVGNERATIGLPVLDVSWERIGISSGLLQTINQMNGGELLKQCVVLGGRK
jgi:hypothetical protein